MSRWQALKDKVGIPAANLPAEEGRDGGLGIGELRVARGMTQVQLAEAMRVDQARVSRFERQEDMFVSTLRDFVAGLGGELEMLVRFPDDQVYWLDPPAGSAAPVVEPTSRGRQADIVVRDRTGRVAKMIEVKHRTGMAQRSASMTQGKRPAKVPRNKV
jgi:transcriptional regulator with XRE-family HTH domain